MANFKINYTLQKQNSDVATAEEMKGEHSSAIGLSSASEVGS